MTDKERKQLRRELKDAIDRSENWILLALIKNQIMKIGDGNVEETQKITQTTEDVIFHLNECKSEIAEKSKRLIEEIDDAIKKIS